MMRQSLFDLLDREPVVVGPGVWDALSAKLAAEAGFEMMFLSGYGLSATSLGEPDFGLITQTEMLAAAERVCSAVDVPVAVDIDTGYGGAFNVERTVEALVRCGAAGCFLEDQIFPKRCGHMDRKRVVPLEEYLPKLRAALESRKEARFFVTARTDARAVLGLDAALDRAKAFVDAGADAVFVEAPESIDELERIGRELSGAVLVANMIEHGKTPLLLPEDLRQLGFRLIAWPLTGLLGAARAMRKAFQTLKAHGTSAELGDQMESFGSFNRFLGLDARYAREAAWLDEPDE